MQMTNTPAINDPRFLPDVEPMFEYYLVDTPKLTYESPEDGPFTRALVRVLEGFLGRNEMEGHYQALKAQDIDSKTFFREAFTQERVEPCGRKLRTSINAIIHPEGLPLGPHSQKGRQHCIEKEWS